MRGYVFNTLSMSVVLVGSWLLLIGCTPVSPQARGKANPHLDFAMVMADTASYIDHYMLAGGSIIALRDDGDGSLLDIQRWEMTRHGAMLHVADDGGHILVYSPSKLDSEEFAAGRLVALCGQVLGKEPVPGSHDGVEALRLKLDEIHLIDTPYRYGLHRNVDPGVPVYLPPKGLGPNHPYDPSAWAYPYSPFTYRVR